MGETNPDTATGKEGDVEARCFRMIYISCPTVSLISGSERDSPRDQLVVTLFLLIVLGLLLGAAIKNRMEKAGLSTQIGRESGRRWWQVSDSNKRGASRTDAALGVASAKAGNGQIWRRRICRGSGSAAIDWLVVSHSVTWVLSAPSEPITLALTSLSHLSPKSKGRRSTLLYSARLIPALLPQPQPSSASKRLAAR